MIEWAWHHIPSDTYAPFRSEEVARREVAEAKNYDHPVELVWRDVGPWIVVEDSDSGSGIGDSQSFESWLSQASEDDKRAASEWRHHYPVEEERWTFDAATPVEAITGVLDQPSERHIVCGCNHSGVPFGSPGHP